MSKEMLVIALGLWIIIVRTLLGIPGSWQTVLLVMTGVALAVVGFLLRGEALARAAHRPRPIQRESSYTFVESAPPRPTAAPEAEADEAHEQKNGINSLN